MQSILAQLRQGPHPPIEAFPEPVLCPDDSCRQKQLRPWKFLDTLLIGKWFLQIYRITIYHAGSEAAVEPDRLASKQHVFQLNTWESEYNNKSKQVCDHCSFSRRASAVRRKALPEADCGDAIIKGTPRSPPSRIAISIGICPRNGTFQRSASR